MMNSSITVGVLTISDRSARNEREDLSGPAIQKILKNNGFDLNEYKIVPDEKNEIKKIFSDWVNEEIHLILTTGGTGFAPRDITPEATMEFIEKETPGISEFLRYKSYQKTPHASLSRAVSGIKNKTLIINLPGSPKAATECVEILIPILPHAIELMVDSPDSERNH
jgi:molybdopterin adenylyltransferase